MGLFQRQPEFPQDAHCRSSQNLHQLGRLNLLHSLDQDALRHQQYHTIRQQYDPLTEVP